MGRKKKETNEAAPTTPQVSTDKLNQGETKLRYVVTRDGHRVSDHEYAASDDPEALEELRFWQLVSSKHSWGEPVKIVKYDNKLHRIYAMNDYGTER